MTGRRSVCFAIAAMLAACDGTIHVRGRVYARSPGDTLVPSAALVDHTGIDTTTLVPLSGASVTLFQRVEDTAAARPESLLWVRRDTSRANGSFNLFDIGPPSAYTAALRLARRLPHGDRGVPAPLVAGDPSRRGGAHAAAEVTG